jgi:plasmid segregation protein ParM
LFDPIDLPILDDTPCSLWKGRNMSIVVRAVDVGFGNTKYVTASAQGQVDCAHFASLAYFGQDEIPVESMGGRRRTVQVPVDGLLYEVGPDVEFAADRFRSRQLHDGYTQTAEYRALATGALHFMKVETVDLLVVGLPVSQYTSKRAALQKAMTGTFHAGRKQRIVVKRALVVPQPQGALYWCAQQNPSVGSPKYKSLVMDVGSRTFDWLVTRGMRVVPHMSDSVTRGVSDILRHIADTVGARMKEDFRDLDAVDRALRSGQILRLNQIDHDLKKFDTAIHKIADQALDFVLARLDGPQELEHIILVGGGAYLYTKAVRRRFPKHKITEVADPMYANVRGFQLLGEQYVRERPELFRADGGSVTSEASESAGSQ